MTANAATRASIVGILLGVFATAGDAAVSEAFPVQLSRNDKALIAHAACAGSEGEAEHLAAFTYQRGPAAIHVEVQCKPHRMEGSFPIARQVECRSQKGQWRCEQGHEVARVVAGTGSISVVPSGVALQTAAEVVAGALKLVVPPFSTPAIRYLSGTCRVQPGSVLADMGIEPFVVKCEHSSLEVSRFCSASRCNYFIVTGSR